MEFEMIAKTFQGLEGVLAEELRQIGATNVEEGRRMVSFTGDKAVLYKANFCCRTALRILKPIYKFLASDADELYEAVKRFNWNEVMKVNQTFSIDTTVFSEEFRHSRFVTYRVKDAIADFFSEQCGERPSIRLNNPDVQFNVHIAGKEVTLSLDSSGEPLYKRGYRVAQTEAPINEVLAAGILKLAGWDGQCNFIDPMCGSGTFLVEAALIAANINPGIYRQHFAFEKWPDFNKELFEELYNDDSSEREFAFKIYGGDIDPEAVAIARKNIKSAQVEEMVELTCRPLADWTDNPEPGVMVMNPPYGQRLKPDDISELYRSIGSSLKKNFPGWHAWIIGLDDETFDNIGLKPSMKIPLLNGSLECMLREYVMFDGSYSDFRAEGGRVSHFGEGEEEERGPRKMRRLSDDEWKRETRKFGGHDKYKKPDRRDDRSDRKPFRRDDREERRDFRSDRRDDRSERKPFRRDDRGERKPFRRGNDRGPKTVPNRGPRISEDFSKVISPVHFRQRKKREESEED